MNSGASRSEIFTSCHNFSSFVSLSLCLLFSIGLVLFWFLLHYGYYSCGKRCSGFFLDHLEMFLAALISFFPPTLCSAISIVALFILYIVTILLSSISPPFFNFVSDTKYSIFSTFHPLHVHGFLSFLHRSWVSILF